MQTERVETNRMKKLLASVPVLLLALAFLGTFFAITSSSPVTHAVQPTVDKTKNVNITGALTKSVTFTGIPVGDTLFVVEYGYASAGTGACHNADTTVSDTLTSTWTFAGHQCASDSTGGGNAQTDAIGYFFTTPSQPTPYSDTITLTASLGSGGGALYHFAGIVEALGSITTSAFRYTNNSVTYPTQCLTCNQIAIAISSFPAYSSGYTVISAVTSKLSSPTSANCPATTCTYSPPSGTTSINATNQCAYGGASTSYASTLCLSYTNSGGSNSYTSVFNYPTSSTLSGGESAISFQGSTTNPFSTCYNSQPVCFEQQATPASATSGTSVTDSLNSNFPNRFLQNPFTEVVEVLVAGTSSASSTTPFIPSGVVSSDFGSLSNTFGTGGSPNYLNFVMTNVLQQCPIIVYNGCVFPQADADSLSLSIWYVTQTSGTTATSDSITVTFANNINTAANTNNYKATVVAGFIGGTTAQTYTPYLFVQASNGIWAKSGSIQSSGGFTATSNPTLATGNIFGSIVSTSSFSTGFAGGNGGWIDGNQCDYASTCASGATGYVYTTTSGNGVGDYLFLDSAYYPNGMTQGAGVISAQPYAGVAVAGALDYTITLYWIPAPTCTNCNGHGGPNTITSTHNVLDSNQTVFYFGYTSAQATILITNITTKIYSVTTTIHSTCNSVASRICIFLGIWILPNQNSINPANPLVLDTVPSCGLVTSSPTTSTPFYIYLSGITCNIPASSTYVVGLSVNHNGVNVYTASSGQMYNDTVDGYQPSKINAFVSNPTPVWLTWTWSMASQTVNIVSTTTITSGATTITSTQYSTIFQLQTGQGGLAVSEQLVGYLPIWIFPVLLGAWFGLIGLFMGFIIGISFGTILGIVPLWMAFLLGLGIVFMMSKLH